MPPAILARAVDPLAGECGTICTMTVLWQPSEEHLADLPLTRFARQMESETGHCFEDYAALHAWSVEEAEDFWRAAWSFLDLQGHPGSTVIDDLHNMPGALWFPEGNVSFAGTILREADDRIAIRARGEHQTQWRTISRSELHAMVGAAAEAMRKAGVVKGDRVVGYLPNIPETIVAMLAASTLGAIWSSCSPDFGVRGVLDRFERLDPKLLVCCDGYAYGGKRIDSRMRTAEILGALEKSVGHAPQVVMVPFLDDGATTEGLPNAVRWDTFLAGGEGVPPDLTPAPFGQPHYIMFSSGTTGLPKCIVQSAGGVLLNQLKEHVLHCSLTQEDNLFYFTTCGWMMWNWLVAGLGTGACITLYDGNPMFPDPNALWRLAEEAGITVFGTSAKYLAALEQMDAVPNTAANTSKVRLILSTGSPLIDESFDYCYRSIREPESDMSLASISGGTDLNGCFVGGVPWSSVVRGEIQGPGLGMAVRVYDPQGQAVLNEMGELVCEQAFPSMPIGFWGDDQQQSKYRAAYFEKFPGVWHHGDFMMFTEEGGIRITGRSDATLNPGGVRIGTAEIYRVVEAMDEVADSIVIGRPTDGDVEVMLFVQLADGVIMDEALTKRIRGEIRAGCTPRHVPAHVKAVPDIPYTISGKKVELAVRCVVLGEDVKNKDALKNPEALIFYQDADSD